MGTPRTDARVSRLRFGADEIAVVSWTLDAPDAAALTPAEREIAELIMRGLSNAEIARLRGRSPRTVANQVASLLRKLGMDGRAGVPAGQEGARS